MLRKIRWQGICCQRIDSPLFSLPLTTSTFKSKGEPANIEDLDQDLVGIAKAERLLSAEELRYLRPKPRFKMNAPQKYYMLQELAKVGDRVEEHLVILVGWCDWVNKFTDTALSLC